MIIVGHGSSLQGKALGGRIDSYDIVVRMKRGLHLTEANPEDFGRKCHYLCASAEVLGCFKDTNEMKEFWVYPKRGYYDLAAVEELRKKWKTPVLVQLNLCNTWNARFQGARHPVVSTGLATVIIAADRLKPHGVKEIVLAGFDTLLNPSIPFSRADLPRTGSGPFPNHDWEKEHELLEHISRHYDVEIKPLE